nr:NAD(+) diphosphatase [Microbacterium sp. SORGH_AS_0888]
MPGSAVSLGLDRCEPERDRDGVLEELRADPGTRVVVVRGDALAVRDAALWRVPATSVDGAEWAFLGRDPAGTALLVAVVDAEAQPPAGSSWAPLRIVGGELSEADADIAATAVSLARWLVDAAFCPNCGTHADLAQAGWSRHCPSCGRIHFPRTDPAVIVAIEDESGEHLLLGANAAWPQGRYSCFAGFVEAGESLESAVAREVYEEAGVLVRAVRYRGSQPWPYPRSLMLGFRAVADPARAAHADGEEIAEVRWFTRAQIGAALDGAGEVTLPGPSSIAHRLIVEWLGTPA